MKLYLERILENDNDLIYNDLPTWSQFDIAKFSTDKKLYSYQQEAIKRVSQVLHLAFNGNATTPRIADMKAKYNAYGFDFASKLTDQNINRTAFWMATGSGKSIVLIKTIELLHWAVKQRLIPKKDIMLLLPREDLISQFKNEIAEYNQSRAVGNAQIRLVNLKDYDDDKRVTTFLDEITVYFYRSDLLRDEHKQTILDYRNYINGGNWYVFLDEAHRGIDNNRNQSKMKQNVAELSKNGFLFNFSATFTEAIDYATCCYNFNLEKFITSGYGKNIYLSNSLLSFKDKKEDLQKTDRQLQILKSIITFCLVKNFKKVDKYHNPLMITYVNSVNITEADLKLFFEEVVKIAKGNIDKALLKRAKDEIKKEFGTTPAPDYIFNKEQLQLNTDELNYIDTFTDNEIFKHFFNTATASNIQWQKGESGKEILLKLVSSTEYFALIRIGDADSFSKSILTNDYQEITTFVKEVHFKKLNEPINTINLLMGSRSFYEGWDSNRPNVINLINIGGREAKKFVPQSIGRGIRIQPNPTDFSKRQRLLDGNADKNQLLETLFVFSTDKNSIKSIMDEIDRSSNNVGSKERSLGHLFNKRNPTFTLLIPTYKEIKTGTATFAQFACSTSSQEKVKKLLNTLSKTSMLINYDITENQYNNLKIAAMSGTIFQTGSDYDDTEYLLELLINHVKHFERQVDSLKQLEEEICHFKQITIEIGGSLTDAEAATLENEIATVSKYTGITFNQWLTTNPAYVSLPAADQQTLFKSNMGSSIKTFKSKLTIANLVEHYYFPLITSSDEKIDYINHIIKVKSEVDFINNLSRHISKTTPTAEWMFSKIDEMCDLGMGMPYFAKDKNMFRKFFPDFIFWVKTQDSYDIYFVDPKGTQSTSWESKADYFQRIFEKTAINDPKEFTYKKFKVRFHLRLLTDDLNKVNGLAYRDYWYKNDDFTFLK